MHEGLAALVTGCSHGVGRAIAERLASRVASLALIDIDREALATLKRELLARHPALQIMCETVDITDGEAVSRVVIEAEQRFGRLDSVINNAGGVISLVASGDVKAQFGLFHETNPADWRAIIGLNLFGAMNVAHAAIPALLRAAQRSGAGNSRLVLVSSVAGVTGAPGIAAYAAAKGGVVALTKSLARELAGDGVCVNSIAPGGVATRAFPAGSTAAAKRAERIPMRRLGEADEIANAVCYLALDAPDYMTGEIINVSGGPP